MTKKCGLVLEGGGMRGIYTAAVLDVFLEKDISFDGVIGVSAGAIHGCSYLSGQRGRSIRYYKKYCSDPRFMSFRSWLTTGDIVGAEFCYHELPEKLDIYDFAAFKKCGVPFYVVCTDVKTGRPAYLQITDMKEEVDLMRASASLPYFSRIVDYNGEKYLDGGCTDSVPVEAFQKMGFEKNLIILTRPADYQKKPEHARLAKLWYRRWPAFANALENRHRTYNETMRFIDRLEKEGRVFVIRPERDLSIGRLEKDPQKVQRVYDTGRADALRCLEDLKRWMEN